MGIKKEYSQVAIKVDEPDRKTSFVNSNGFTKSVKYPIVSCLRIFSSSISIPIGILLFALFFPAIMKTASKF